MDEQGRPYYYSADGSRSEWELPKVNSASGKLKCGDFTYTAEVIVFGLDDVKFGLKNKKLYFNIV